MTDRPRMQLTATVLDAPDPVALADFYHRLLGWPVARSEATWAKLTAPGGAALSFQLEPEYVPPSWPSTSDRQQMQLHLDIEVDDLVAAAAHAESIGATLAHFQPQDDVRVYLDPVGHPFCLWVRT